LNGTNRFCELEDDFGAAEEREIAVLSDDQLSDPSPEENNILSFQHRGPIFFEENNTRRLEFM